MNDRAMAPTDRATAVYVPGPEPMLVCSHCEGAVTDDDPECPHCGSPIDWGASDSALQSWYDARA